MSRGSVRAEARPHARADNLCGTYCSTPGTGRVPSRASGGGLGFQSTTRPPPPASSAPHPSTHTSPHRRSSDESDNNSTPSVHPGWTPRWWRLCTDQARRGKFSAYTHSPWQRLHWSKLSFLISHTGLLDGLGCCRCCWLRHGG